MLVLTEWDEFKHLDYVRIHLSLRYPIIVDGRNLLFPEEMCKLDFIHTSTGRLDVIPSEPNRHASAEVVA
jgi:UDPglucose 6-dehydrogenase